MLGKYILQPSRKDMGMSFDKLCGTEEYAVCLAQEEQEWHQYYDALIEKKIQLFDKLVCMHTIEAYDLIEKLIDDAMTEAVQKRNTSYAFMVIFVQIYRAEKQVNEHRFLFDCGDSLEELIAIIQQLKFYMWELEFLEEKETEEWLRQFVKHYDIRAELLRNIILMACMDKDRMKKVVGNVLGIVM